MHILILNGPNLNLLGVREPSIYGSNSYEDLCRMIRERCACDGIEVTIRQSNHEGVLVDEIQAALGVCDGIVINPAAYTHTSIAILDAVKAVGIPTVEVHISDPGRREEFRQTSYVRAACIATVAGRGITGYLDAIDLLVRHIVENR